MEAVVDTSGPKKAVEVIRAQLDSFFTAVLATVHAGAWRLTDRRAPLCASVQREALQSTHLLAIKGGDACDCEIKSSRRLWRSLARGERFREVSGDGQTSNGPGTKRKGGSPGRLYQYQKVEYALWGCSSSISCRINLHARTKPQARRRRLAPVVDKRRSRSRSGSTRM